MNQRVFLAAPFKQLLNQNNRVNTETTQALQQVMQVLEDKGMFVDNAHKRENWGLEMMTPTQCTDADFNSIKNCDVLMAFPGALHHQVPILKLAGRQHFIKRLFCF
ncbi:hypothetical protein [Leuconostoc mesenteroides]|uniref:hypothetical protein n=1 Tax=Leuconostoc mesenteroides TaxID=1245 RepID=UPI002362BBEE|nr:hypothetical protein [Leuconostoc mesenteroides]